MNNSILKMAAMLSFAALVGSCSHEEKSDLENSGLMGNVKSITTVSYDVYDKFGEGSLKKSKPEYAIIQVARFDSLGNVLLEQSLMISEAKRWCTSVYNSKSQETKRAYYDSDDDSKVYMGDLYYYDEKGNLVKEVDLMDNDVINYKNTYDNEGRLISQIGGPNKKYWEYENGILVKGVELFYDMRTDLYYKDGLLYKDVRNPEIYWTHSYDAQKRSYEDIMYKNDNVNKKLRSIYAGEDDLSPIEKIEWNADGSIEHDYTFSYFVVGNDTVTVLKFDKDILSEITFYQKDAQGVTVDVFKAESNLIFGRQYNYENGILTSLRDLEEGGDHKYIDGIATIIEDDGDVTETKYKRNNQVSRTTKDKSGKIKYSYVIDGDDNKKTITIIDNGETKKGEQVFENGRLVKIIDAVSGLTSTLSYNEAGYVSEVKSSDGTVLTYKYEFDKQGNWVQEIEYKNGKPNKIWERSIIYY